MSEKIKFIKDVGWVFLGSVIALILRFLVKSIIGRFLGPSNLGLYSLSLTIYSFSLLFATLCINSAIVKYVAEYKDKKNILKSIISTASLNAIIFGIITSIILYSFSGIISTFFNEPRIKNF